MRRAAQQVGGVGQHVDVLVERRPVRGAGPHHERPPGDQADEAATRGAGLDEPVVDVARVWRQAAGIRVAEDHGIAAAVDDLARRPRADVCAVEHDAEPVALLDDEPSEARDTAARRVEQPVADLVGAVVGRDHHAQAEPVHHLEAVQPPADEVAALREEQQRGASGFAGPPHFAHRDGDVEVRVAAPDEVPVHQPFDRLVEGVVRVERGHTVGGDAVAVRYIEAAVRPRLHAQVHHQERARGVHDRMFTAAIAVGGDGHRVTSIA